MMTEDTLRLLSLLGARLKNEPRFMAHALDRYCRNNELSETGLASKLSASREAIVRLSLCHKPDPESPNFDEQVRHLARHTSIDEGFLSEMLQPTAPRSVGTVSERDSYFRRVFHFFRMVAPEKQVVFAAVSAVLVLAGAVSTLFWSQSHSRRDQFGIGDFQESPGVSVAPEIEANGKHNDLGRAKPFPIPDTRNTNSLNGAAAASPPSELNRTRTSIRQVASVVVRLKFDNTGILRDGGEPPVNRESIIIFKRAVTQLNIELPLGYGAGRYEVSVQDAFGQPVLRTQATSPNGRSIHARLDLRGLVPKSYYLCVQRDRDVPDCNSVEISEESKR